MDFTGLGYGIIFAVIGCLSLTLAWSSLPISAATRRESLRGKIILVTGGGSGIGAATCRLLAQYDAIVVVWDVQLAAAQAVVRDIVADGGRAHAWAVDVSDREAVRAAAAAVRQELQTAGVYGLVNNAGIVSGAQLLGLRPEQIERTMAVNVLAHFWTLQEFLPSMLRGECVPIGVNRIGDVGGHVVTVASTMSFSGASGLSDYVASKHAVWGMHECLRLELAHLHAQGKAHVGCECCGYVVPFFERYSNYAVLTCETIRMHRFHRLSIRHIDRYVRRNRVSMVEPTISADPRT